MTTQVLFLCLLIFLTIFYSNGKEVYVKVVTGNADNDFTGDNGPAALAQVSFGGNTGKYGGVWADSMGTVYISDGGNSRVRRIDSVNGNISTIAGTGTFNIFGGTGPGTSTRIYYPWFITGDTIGSAVYFTDHYNLWKYTTSDGMVTSLPGPNGKYGVWVATTGFIYMTEIYENRIYQLDENLVLTVFAGRSISGGGFTGDGGQATSAKFNMPKGIYLDTTTGMFYIADSNNNRIRRINTATGIITTFAGGGDSSAYSSSSGGIPATSAAFGLPLDVKGDRFGNIYLVGYTCKLAQVDNSGIIRSLIGNEASCGSVLSFTLASQATVNSLDSIYVDSSADLYFCAEGLVQRTVTLDNPTGFPSSPPSGRPSGYPTSLPSSHPSHTASPTVLPTERPTFTPSSDPTVEPTMFPSFNPIVDPTVKPTERPTTLPTTTTCPSWIPSAIPTTLPSTPPTTRIPSLSPTTVPTEMPTELPTKIPTADPTVIPSLIPSERPVTEIPSVDPTLVPSSAPVTPTNNPAFSTPRPSVASTYFLTADPTMIPSEVPSTMKPTGKPSTSKPSDKPSFSPSIFPTSTITTKDVLLFTGAPTTSRPSSGEPTTKPTTTVQPVAVPTSVPFFLSSAKPSLSPSSAIPSTVPSLLSSSAIPTAATLLDSDLSSNTNANKSQSANTTVVAISASVGAIGGLLVVLLGIFYFRKKYFTTMKVEDETKMTAKKMENLEEGGDGEASNYLAITAGTGSAGGGGLFQKFKNDYKILSGTASNNTKVQPVLMIPSVVPSKLVLFPCPMGINDFQWNGIELDPLTTDVGSILLGSGSFARVFKARLKKSKEIIAIKTVTNLACELKGMDYEVRIMFCLLFCLFSS
jgi:hypothetical protein